MVWTSCRKEADEGRAERVPEGELATQLGYEKRAAEGWSTGNPRNGEFDPRRVERDKHRLPGFDDKLIALYARGLMTREIQGRLPDPCDVEVSPTLASKVSDAALDGVRAWQSRSLDVAPRSPISTRFTGSQARAGPCRTR